MAKNNNKYWLRITGVILIFIAIILIIFFFLRGETKVTGNWDGSSTAESITCQGKNIVYDFFSDKKEISSDSKINAIFNDGKISSISLVRKTNYADAETAKSMSNQHEFDLNQSFAEKGLKAYALNAKFDINEVTDQMRLYAESDDINEITIQYFILKRLPKDISGYATAYAEQGFNCDIVNDNK